MIPHPSSSSQSRVTTEVEKSRARFKTPERPVRKRVFAILVVTASKRLCSTARVMGSSFVFCFARPVFALAMIYSWSVMKRLPLLVRSALAPGSITTVVNGDSMMDGPRIAEPAFMESNAATRAFTKPLPAK